MLRKIKCEEVEGGRTRTRETPTPSLSHCEPNSVVSPAWVVLNPALNAGDFLAGESLPLPGFSVPRGPIRVSPLSLRPTQSVKWLSWESVVSPWECCQSLPPPPRPSPGAHAGGSSARALLLSCLGKRRMRGGCAGHAPFSPWHTPVGRRGAHAGTGEDVTAASHRSLGSGAAGGEIWGLREREQPGPARRGPPPGNGTVVTRG